MHPNDRVHGGQSTVAVMSALSEMEWENRGRAG